MYLHVSALLWHTRRNKPIILVGAVSFQKGGVSRSPRTIAVGRTIYSWNKITWFSQKKEKKKKYLTAKNIFKGLLLLITKHHITTYFSVKGLRTFWPPVIFSALKLVNYDKKNTKRVNNWPNREKKRKTMVKFEYEHSGGLPGRIKLKNAT